jgi:hypothetical protein
MPSPTLSGANGLKFWHEGKFQMKVFKRSFSIKLLPVLAVLVSMGAISAQAHTVSQANVVTPTVQSWATNFGFLPFNSSSCTDVQTGFWPRPLECKR